jgi:hypothetical protein
MACWLYQMNANRYSHERYRNEVWEGNLVTNWGIGESTHRPKEMVPGDMLILFYAKVSKIEFGIFGWGIIMFFDKLTEDLNFRPASPSDYLKMNPLWDDEISLIIDQIRGGFPEGTMWKIDKKVLEQIREKIAKHAYGINP